MKNEHQFSINSGLPALSVIKSDFFYFDFEDAKLPFVVASGHDDFITKKRQLEGLMDSSIEGTAQDTMFDDVVPMSAVLKGEAGHTIFGVWAGFSATVNLGEIKKRHAHLAFICDLIDYISVAPEQKEDGSYAVQISAIYDEANFHSNEVANRGLDQTKLKELTSKCLEAVRAEYNQLKKRLGTNYAAAVTTRL